MREEEYPQTLLDMPKMENEPAPSFHDIQTEVETEPSRTEGPGRAGARAAGTELGARASRARKGTTARAPMVTDLAPRKPKPGGTSAVAFRGTALLTMVRDRIKGASGKSAMFKPGGIQTNEMNALLGGSLFASGDIHTRTRDRKKPRSRRRWRSAVLMIIVAGAALGGNRVVGQVRAQVAAGECRHTIADLQEALSTGSITRMETLLPIAEKLAADAGVAGDHCALFMRTEAMLYRYHDAAPERRARAERLLSRDCRGFAEEAVITEALLRSAAGRVPLIAGLQGAAAKHPEDSEVMFLLATALAHNGSHASASSALSKAEFLAPSNLPHLIGYIDHHIRLGRALEVENMLTQIRDISPDSPWTKLAEALTAQVQTESDGTKDELAQISPDLSPVLAARMHEVRARQLLKKGQREAAGVELEAAAEAIHNEAPFLIDLTETLVADSRYEAGSRITKLAGWSSTAPGAADVEARLTLVAARSGGDHGKLKPKRPSSSAKRSKRKRAL